MIKKIIYILGTFMMLSGLINSAFDVKSAYGEEDTCGEILFDSTGESRECFIDRLSSNKHTNWGQRFGEKKASEAAQDLYLMIYKKTAVNPNKEAIEKTAAKYGMLSGQMQGILAGNIRPILERRPNMSIIEAQNIYNQIIDTYNTNLNVSSVESTIKTKIEASEIFANGKLSDSGFDLIHDLENIEKILFLRSMPLSIGGDYIRRSPTTSSPRPQINSNQALPAPVTPSFERGGISGSTTRLNPLLHEVNPWQNIGGINPNICLADSNLSNSLNSYGSRSGESTETDGSSQSVNGIASNTLPSDLLPSNILSGTEASVETKILPAKGHNWKKQEICEDILCVNLEFVIKKAEAVFRRTDNCIACHVEFINESLEETIKHNLIPAKVPGNFGEGALCKDAAGIALNKIGMNIAYTLVPVVTPAKDDLMNLGNIQDEWKEYASRNGFWNYSEKRRKELLQKKQGAEIFLEPELDNMERQVMLALESVPSDATVTAVWDHANQSYMTEVSYSIQEAQELHAAKDGFSSISTYEILRDEMIAMNGYFLSIKKIMTSLNKDVDGVNSTKACALLNEKEKCR